MRFYFGIPERICDWEAEYQIVINFDAKTVRRDSMSHEILNYFNSRNIIYREALGRFCTTSIALSIDDELNFLKA